MAEISILTIYFISYLIGSIPFGLIIARITTGKDIRNLGSGNIGTTNAVRTLGKKLGALTLLLDIAKTLLAIKLAKIYDLNIYLAAILSILGHIFPIWLNFKGGKGVAGSFAALLYIEPILGLIFFICWSTIFLLSKISALASIISIICVLVITLLSNSDHSLKYFVGALVIIIIFTHIANIRRMITNNELTFRS